MTATCAAVGLGGAGYQPGVGWSPADQANVAAGLGLANGGIGGCCVEFAWVEGGALYTHNNGPEFYNWDGCWNGFPTVKVCTP